MKRLGYADRWRAWWCLFAATGPEYPPRRVALAPHRPSSRKFRFQRIQDIEILKNRKKISTGELSVIVFAKKTRQAVLQTIPTR